MPSQNFKRGGSKQSLEELIDVLDLTDLQKRFLRSRWLEQLLWMGTRTKSARNWYYTLRLTTIIGGVIVPVLVVLNTSNNSLDKNFAPAVRWLTVGVSAVVAVSSAVEEFFHYGDRWRHYRQTAESLKTQGWQFSQLCGLYGSYNSHQEAFPNFAAQVEGILQRDVEVYVTEVVREKEKQKESSDRELTKEISHKSVAANSVSETTKSE